MTGYGLIFLYFCTELLIALISYVERQIPVLQAANLTKYNLV